tara:strand:+ start:613 stop:825 length:213 start_codon:yes stop_codon:yes gene_type:complete
MAAKSTTITVEKVINYIKEKWQIFGIATLIIFVLQLLSTKILLSVLLGIVVTALLPSDTVKKVTKKITKE